MKIDITLNLDNLEYVQETGYYMTERQGSNLRKIYGNTTDKFSELAKTIFIACNHDELEDHEVDIMLKSIEKSLIQLAIKQQFDF